MKKNIFIGMLVVLTAAFAFKHSHPSLEIGDALPKGDIKMKDVSNTSYSLNDLKKENGLLVIFSCNTCPFVVGTGSKEGWQGRYNGLYDMATKAGIGMVLVNSNEAKRKGDDSFEAMVTHNKSQGYKSKYIVDENHVVADAFGAKSTPHVFLFNKQMKLVYKGAIDDNNASAAKVKKHYLKDALSQLKAGNSIEVNTTNALGCSIKRVSHSH